MSEEPFAILMVLVFLILSVYLWSRKKLMVIVFLAGIWCVLDGLYSMFRYADQSWVDHSIRFLRFVVGVYLIAIYFKIRQRIFPSQFLYGRKKTKK